MSELAIPKTNTVPPEAKLFLDSRVKVLQSVEAPPAIKEEAFTGIVLEHHPNLLRFALRKTGSRPEAEDLTQETLIKAWLNIEKFAGRASLSTWLHQILRNKLIDKGRYNNSRPKTIDQDMAELSDKLLSTPDHVDPAQIYETRETILSALSQIPSDKPELLMYAGGYSYKEIAEHVGTPLGTTKDRINKSRQRIGKLALAEV